MGFTVDRATGRTGPVLRVRGELDVATAPVLAAEVEAELATRPGGLVVDLAGTTFLDSSGFRELALAAKRAAGAGVPLTVSCPRGNTAVRAVLDFLDLSSLVPVVEAPPA